MAVQELSIELPAEVIAKLQENNLIKDGVIEAFNRGKGKRYKTFYKLAVSNSKQQEVQSQAAKVAALLNKNNQINLRNMQMLGNITKLSQLTMVLSGLNLFATVAGFAIMNARLNKISGKVDQVISTQKDIFDIQTVYNINKVITKYSNMMDGRKIQEPFSEGEMRELVGDEWNALDMLLRVFYKGVNNNKEELVFSILSLASMLATSLRYYDEMYYFKHKDITKGHNVWHNDHDKWMAIFDRMLGMDFIERIQDYGFFTMGLNTEEDDYFYLSYIEQIRSLKQDVEDNQMLITSLDDPELFRAFNDEISNQVRSEIEAALEEAGVDKKVFEEPIRAAAA